MTSLVTCALFAQVLLMTSAERQQPRRNRAQADAMTTKKAVDCDQRASCSYVDEQLRNCYCDTLCRVYGDCCADSDVTSSDVTSPSGAAVVASCQRLPDVVGRDSELYVVSRCPSSYDHDADVKRRCQLHSSDNLADRFYRLPVVVQSDPLRLTYRNVYCAACAAAAGRPTFYLIEVKCKSLPSSEDVTVESLLRSSSCRVVYAAPSSMPSSRTCRSHIGRCDRRWADKAVIDRCRRGPVSYVYAGTHAFRNRDCARCNYVNDTYVSCDVTSSLQRPSTARDATTWRTVAVIDVNRRRFVFNYITDHQRLRAVYELPRCQRHSVYDPFTEQCRTVPSLRLTDDDDEATTESRQYATDSVELVNVSGLQFSLYAVRTRTERLAALLAGVVSTVSLVVLVVVITLRPALRAPVHGRTLLAAVLSLLLTQIIYVLVVPLVDVIGSASLTCFCLSVALHYVSLTSLCWLVALAISVLYSAKSHSFACGCVFALCAALPVCVSVLVLSVLQLDGSDRGPSCWTIGLSQLMLHTLMLLIVLGVNCVLYLVAVCRRRRAVTGPMCVSALLTLIVLTDAASSVAAAVLPESTCVIYLSLALHAALGPAVCLTVLLPLCLHTRSSLRWQNVTNL